MNIYRRPETPKSSKYASIIAKFELPEFAQLEPSRKVPEVRFVGVAQSLQNKRKSIKITIYSHPKRPESSKKYFFKFSRNFSKILFLIEKSIFILSENADDMLPICCFFVTVHNQRKKTAVKLKKHKFLKCF